MTEAVLDRSDDGMHPKKMASKRQNGFSFIYRCFNQVQECFEQFPQEDGSIFLFNVYTGEAIYDVDRWGSPLPDAHKLSHWFEPTAIVPPLHTEDSPSGRAHISDVSFR